MRISRGFRMAWRRLPGSPFLSGCGAIRLEGSDREAGEDWEIYNATMVKLDRLIFSCSKRQPLGLQIWAQKRRNSLIGIESEPFSQSHCCSEAIPAG